MRRLIRCDGTTQDFDKPLGMTECRRLIGADSIDTVTMRHMGAPLHVMLVDGQGWEATPVEIPNGVRLVPTRALKPINAVATQIYLLNCIPGTTHQIVGDVLIVPDEDFE